jgi:S1-C subfamily serine protease
VNALDVLLGVAALLFAVSGYRQGFVVGVLGFAGFVAGGVAGLLVTPTLISRVDAGLAQTILAIGIVLVLASLGQLLLGTLGGSLRRRLSWRPAQVVDSLLGAALSVLALLLVAWSLGSALRPGPITTLSRQISGSEVIRSVDAAMPDRAHTAFRSIRSALDDNGLPTVFAGLSPEHIRPVRPPSAQIAATPAIRRAGTSVVKIDGVADECDRHVDGTGFVFAKGYVLTNAHVVAGVDEPRVQLGGTGRHYPATTVLYDPGRDLAVLRVADFPARPLLFDEGGSRGDEAVVAGFPGGGVYRLSPARIRETIDARGPDIYQRRTVEREVFSLYADIRPGNSGGPLLDLEGEVYGVVFAKSLDDANTGYALTAEEIQPVVRKGNGLKDTVETGACT